MNMLAFILKEVKLEKQLKTSIYPQDHKPKHNRKSKILQPLLTSFLRLFEFSLGLGKLVLQILDIFNCFLDRDGLGVTIRFSGK